MRRNIILRTVAAFAVGVFAASAALGQTFTPAAAKKPDIKADLTVGGSTAAAPDERWLGVHLNLGPGWKTYWKSPGDAGLPTEFDWSGSSNLADAEVQWPAPSRLSILGFETVGYTHEVLFPVRLKVRDPNVEARIRLKLVVYACSAICVRDERMLDATIRPGAGGPSQAAIDAWRSKVPGPTSDVLSVLSIERSSTGPASLRIEVSSKKPLLAPDAFIESDPPLSGDKPVVTFDHGNRATLTVDLPGETANSIRNRTVKATVVSGGESVLALSPAVRAGESGSLPASVDPRPASAPSTLLALIGIALAGGFILNLMPCVFPVLSLKLLSFVHGSTADKRQVRRGFTATAAGILLSFLALAGVLASMKAAGASVGWGIQFQQPVFLAGMAIVLSLFAASQFELLHLNAPTALLTKVSGTIAGGTSTTSHFFSGFVATLLATPCSAPLVGTAVGFALSQGTGEILVIFASLGIGMASPYLIVAAFPGLAKFIPRPGPWLAGVKRVFGIALLATAGWLLMVLGEVAGTMLALSVGAALASALAVLGLAKGAPPKMVAGAGAAIAVLMAALAAFTPDHRSPAQQIPWRTFSAHELQLLVAAGRTVFVDVTADWCITCKINKVLVINGQEVAGRLSSDVVPLRADWTKPDPEIARFLNKYGRYGIPFNIVFGPAAPDGIALSEILSTSSVSAALNDAAARSK